MTRMNLDAARMTSPVGYPKKHHPSNTNLPPLPELVDIKITNDISILAPSFPSAEIPWIQHSYKARKNKRYQELGADNVKLTRILRLSSTIVKCSDIIKLLALSRTRDVAQVRVRLALLEMAHRRQCAGKVGKFSLRELRTLIGATRITDADILAIVDAPKIDASETTIQEIADRLGQTNLDRPVWIPRRTLRHLAAEGSRLEIAAMLTLLVRRMRARFGRARVSAQMIADCAGAGERHAAAALLKLQEKRLIMKNNQAERWSINRWGSLYDFPEDLSIDPNNEQKPLRAPPKAKRTFTRVALSAVFALWSTSIHAEQKGMPLINRYPSLQLEPQLIAPTVLPVVPQRPSEARNERKTAAAAAALLKIDRGPQGFYYRNAFKNVHDAEQAAEVLELHGFEKFNSYFNRFPPHIGTGKPWRHRKLFRKPLPAAVSIREVQAAKPLSAQTDDALRERKLLLQRQVKELEELCRGK